MIEGHAGGVGTRPLDAPRTAPSVLVPTDFSKEGEAAFEHGLRIAVARQGRLTLLHCGPERRDEVPWDRFPSVRRTLARWGMVPVDAARSEVTARLGIGVDKMAQRDDDPRQGIVDHLRRNRSDLLVLSARARAPMARLLRPSLAETVAYRARTPTLVLPPGGPGFVDPATGAAGLQRVLCVLDASLDQRNAMSFLSHWLPAMGPGRIDVVFPRPGEGGASGSPPLLPNVDRLRWLALQGAPETPAEVVDAARAVGAGMVVLNAVRLPGARERYRGSRLERIVGELGLPALALPGG